MQRWVLSMCSVLGCAVCAVCAPGQYAEVSRVIDAGGGASSNAMNSAWMDVLHAVLSDQLDEVLRRLKTQAQPVVGVRMRCTAGSCSTHAA